MPIKKVTHFARCIATALMTAVCGTLPACARSDEPSSILKSEAGPAEVATRVAALLRRVKRELRPLPAGTFEMGDWGNSEGLPYESETDARPLHKVTLDGFSMMAYKVSYEDFDLFTDATGQPRINQDPFGLKQRAPRKPATVNWFGAKAYCDWLGKHSGLPFDLPTEAQWEYAARSGGKRVLFATDNGKVDDGRNYPSEDLQDRRTPDIGAYPPNPSGFFGLLELRATEWTRDWYDPEYYQRSPTMNPKGPERGTVSAEDVAFGAKRVVRGLQGSSPAFGGFVFSRGARWPYAIAHKGLKLSESKLLTDPSAGYSNSVGSQVRCVVDDSVSHR